MKTRKDVGELLEQIVLVTSNKFDMGDKKHEKALNKLADYLFKYGGDVAYDVLSEYMYVAVGGWFDWSKILDILKEHLAKEYLTPTEAYNFLNELTGKYGRVNKFLAEDNLKNYPLIQQTIDDMGGWIAMCNMEPDKVKTIFINQYSKILEKTITEKMKECAI